MTAQTPKRAYHHGDLERTLVAAALEVIADRGLEDFTLRDIARRVGVAPSAPYRHFPDKDALLAAVAAECAERLGAAMDKAATQAGSDMMARFRAAGIAYVRFAVENPAYFRVMTLPTIARRDAMSTGVGEWMATQMAELQAAQGAGALAPYPAEVILLATRAMTYGLARLIVDDQDGLGGMDADRAAAVAEQVTEVLGLGLLPR
ncbi:TetR/AcrR family transcriptional regulator [Zavarzinia sp. CC-PAN008]|uniref:TetR/AcrR family transcriptional regulator n=1 Tax=Zavarzinia sp. CC-PAN008 TaxID=3243332 RepID=UPI003F745C40